jgi:hypothetical protein
MLCRGSADDLVVGAFYPSSRFEQHHSRHPFQTPRQSDTAFLVKQAERMNAAPR